MALNGAYAALIEAGFAVPKYFAALDAREVNVNFLRDPRKETQFFLASQCHSKMFDLLEGYDVTAFHLNTESTLSVLGVGYEGSFLGSAGGTMGSTSLALAGILGYRHLILVGFDSSHAQNLSHLVVQPQNVGEHTMEVEFDGKWYRTTPTLAAQVNEFVPWMNALRNTWPEIVVDFIGQGLLYDYMEALSNGGPRAVTREAELAKYEVIYNTDPEYHSTEKRLAGVRRALESVYAPSLSYLDVSCGRGETLDLARELGFEGVSGTETVASLIESRSDVVEAILPDTHLPSKCADVVSLIEVIEHLVPADVEPALRELGRLARKHIVISAATTPSFHNFVSLHPSHRPADEWDALFRKVFPTALVKRLPYNFPPSPAWIITL
jgi:SAM-dependent methyltransferase